jgi:stage II sporulation protein D
MLKAFSLFLALLSVLCITWHASASENIKVLILNEVYTQIPAKNEKIEKVGSMRGDLLLMGTGYGGSIDIWKGDRGLYIINELPLEEYIKDVVAAEVGPDWDMEALKVQAVISRTYALFQKRINGGSPYQIASSVLHQVYKGKNPDARIAYAVSETSGQILAFNGKLIEALYHSTCGGRTEDAEDVFGKKYPYLKPVESSCDLSPYSSWSRKIKVEEIEKALNTKGIREIRVKSFTSTKRAKQLTVKSRSGTMTINATDFRKALGWSRLPSTNFSLSHHGDSINFEGKGYGHGVGLCQWGALKMAREGKDYREILSFFYPGTTIQSYENH